jgi:hypothetical protein
MELKTADANALCRKPLRSIKLVTCQDAYLSTTLENLILRLSLKRTQSSATRPARQRQSIVGKVALLPRATPSYFFIFGEPLFCLWVQFVNPNSRNFKALTLADKQSTQKRLHPHKIARFGLEEVYW